MAPVADQREARKAAIPNFQITDSPYAGNAVIEAAFDRATVETPGAVGESGWLTAISVALVLAVTRGVWTLQRSPGERLTLPSGPPPPGLSL